MASTGTVLLPKKITSETRAPFDLVREVKIHVGAKSCLPFLVQDLEEQRFRLGIRQRRHVQRFKPTVDTKFGRLPGQNMKVGPTLFSECTEEAVDSCHTD
jgi:hypothetical protein